jgi:LysM repeat protein
MKAFREQTIRSLPPLAGQSSVNSKPVTVSRQKVLTSTSKYIHKNRKRVTRYGLLIGNLAIVICAGLLVVTHSNSSGTLNFSALNTVNESKDSNPLDTLSSTDIAANIAIMARLPETGLIINEADSVNARLSDPVNTKEVVLKPQILSTVIKSKYDIKDHVVAQGDTLASLALLYGVTSDSIKWSNSLTSNNINVGAKLVIPPINGIAYKVNSGDTPDSLSKKFNVPSEQIVQFNDAEISGLVAGERIVIPGGTIVAAAINRSITPFYAGFAFGDSAVYGYNGYVPGYCTWYAANQRANIGRPLPANLGNATTWDNYAPQGWDRSPRPGDIVVTSEYGAGHVAYVEQVYEDGSVYVSEMNYRGRYVVSNRLFSPAEAAGYKYIH